MSHRSYLDTFLPRGY